MTAIANGFTLDTTNLRVLEEGKALTKKEQVYAMLLNAAMTLDAIAEKMSIGRVAAGALIGDLRRDGKEITAIKVIGDRKVAYHG